MRTELPIVIDADRAVVATMLGFGADDLQRCYQCGTCSVVCPRTPLEQAFPRKEMVWAQWGMADRLLADADAWLCYQCNDCITHCPVDAKPGDVMAAIRTYQINHYAVPRFLAKVSTRAKYLPLAFLGPALMVAAIVVGAVLVPNGGRFVFPDGPILFANFIPHIFIDAFTLGLLGLVGMLSATGLRRFWRTIVESGPQPDARRPFGPSLVAALGEVFSHQGFRDCTTSRHRHTAHLGIFYGFLLLVAATTGAFVYTVVLPALGVGYRGGELSLPIWDPVKIIGNVGFVLLIVGATRAAYVRFAQGRVAGNSVFFDWFFVGVLYATAVTGIVLELLRYAGLAAAAYTTYLVHLLFVFTLLGYLPYSKFAHLFYRTLAHTHAKQVGREPERTFAADGARRATAAPR